MRKHLSFILSLVAFAFAAMAQEQCMPDMRTGEFISHWPNGNMRLKENYLNGMLHGEVSKYDEQGRLISVYNYKSKQYHGSFTEYYNNGKIKKRGRYNDGTSTGTWQEYYYSGQLMREIVYSFGSLVSMKEWWENGNRKARSKFYDGKPADTMMTWYENGQMEKMLRYAAGYPSGDYAQWYSNGQLFHKGTAVGGRMVLKGPDTTYHRNGRVRSVTRYCRLGRDMDVSPGLYPLTFDAHAINVLKHEASVEYDSTGRTRETGYWLYNNKHGAWRQYINGTPSFEEHYAYGQLLRKVNLEEATWESGFEHLRDDGTKDSVKAITRGEVKNGRYLVMNVKDGDRKTLLDNGKGRYSGPYQYVADLGDYTDSSAYRNYHFTRGYLGELRNTNVIIDEWDLFFRRGEGGYYGAFSKGGSSYPKEYGWAEGRFRNGLREGEWIEADGYDKRLFSGKEPMFGTKYAKGEYRDGKKHGRWEFCSGYIVFSGEYLNGKKEGTWKSVLRDTTTFRLDRNHYYDDYWDRSAVVLMEGQYKNGVKHGVWKKFTAGGRPVEDFLYIDGRFIGKIKGYYQNGKLYFEGERFEDTVRITKAYSPRGHELRLEKGSIPSQYTEVKDGKPHGLYYSWNSDGRIIEEGFFRNGMNEGKWIRYDSYSGDTSSISHYRNGKLHGLHKAYIHNLGPDSLFGYYSDGKRVGYWREYGYECIQEVIYYDDAFDGDPDMKKAIINTWGKYRNDRGVADGEGMVKGNNRHTYYRNGLPYREVSFYYFGNNKMEHEKYFWPFVSSRHDSLANYWTEDGGHCVLAGEGKVIEMDRYNRVEYIRYYEEGIQVKYDVYKKGIFNDQVWKPVTKRTPVSPSITVSREFIPQGNNSYLVTVYITPAMPLPGKSFLQETIPGMNFLLLDCDGCINEENTKQPVLEWSKMQARTYKIIYQVTGTRPDLYLYYPGFFGWYNGKSEHRKLIGKQNTTVKSE
jgi:antitoxin component YwqK of YwqJK toxin-antitoxin module